MEETAEQWAEQLRERRPVAWRGARRVLWRPGFRSTVGELPYDADVLTDAGTLQAEETKTSLLPRLWDRGGPGLAFTEVTVGAAGLEWTTDDVRAAVTDFVARLPR